MEGLHKSQTLSLSSIKLPLIFSLPIMDQNESTVPMSTSNSRPISPSPVTETAVAAPATVGEGINVVTNKKRDWPKIYGRDARGKFISKNGTQKKRSSKESRGDMLTLGGGDFTPHIFTVHKGEDIITRIMSFTGNGSRGISVLSAIGTVANVKIQQLDSPRHVVTYKEVYEIVKLNNSITISESGVVKSKTGGWRVTIGGIDGNIFGGALVGRLIAASPVQVVIGSFWPLVTNPSWKRNDESTAEVVAPTIPNSLASSSTGQVQQQDMVVPSHSQKKNDESQDVVVPPTEPSALAFLSTGLVQQTDMVGPSHSQKRNDESQAVVVPPTEPIALAFLPTGQVQQPDMIGPSHSQKRNDESQAVVVPPTIRSLLAFLSTGNAQHLEMIGPSHSQQRNDESQDVVVPPTIPSTLASSSTGNAQQPDMTGPTPFLTLGWYSSESDDKK